MDIIDLTSSTDNDDLIVIQSHPKYKHIKKSNYKLIGGIKTTDLNFIESHECYCVSKCGSRCVNRLLQIECLSKKRSFDSNCAIGCACSNRNFTNREYISLDICHEPSRGYSLRTVTSIHAGSFVIEYVGEVINTETMNCRMLQQRVQSPDDLAFYIMALENGLFIDSKLKGNESRFINHSCDPNCRLERWNVQGRTHIGIFAIRNIEAEDFLSYDYRLETPEESIFGCECSSINCRGTLAYSQLVLNKKRKM